MLDVDLDELTEKSPHLKSWLKSVHYFSARSSANILKLTLGGPSRSFSWDVGRKMEERDSAKNKGICSVTPFLARYEWTEIKLEPHHLSFIPAVSHFVCIWFHRLSLFESRNWMPLWLSVNQLILPWGRLSGKSIGLQIFDLVIGRRAQYESLLSETVPGRNSYPCFTESDLVQSVTQKNK